MKEMEKHLIEALRNSAEHFMTTDFEWSNALVHLLLDSADAIEQKKERAEMIGLDGNICYLPNTLRQIVISNPNMGAFKKETLCKAADAIEELLKENGELENSGRVLMAAFARLKERLPHWISVEERLPDVAEKVLTYNGDFVSENWLCTVASKVGRINVWAYSDGFVTHWMPLPSAPKEETE